MKKSLITSVLFAGLLLTGCFHATVETNKAPSNVVIEQPFALSFVYGLVPPPTVNASEKCTNGVSKVETKISFVNGLVSALTFSLFTPMNIKVTCAAGNAMLNHAETTDESITMLKDASERQMQEAYLTAVDLAVQNHETKYVKSE